MVMLLHASGGEFVRLRDLIAMFVVSILTSAAEIVFYSKKEPKRLETIIRTAVHLLLVIGIMLSVAIYMEWILWSEPIHIVLLTGWVIGTYIVISAVVFYQSKKLADELNEKLKERYKG
jgi:ABC-type iron transport system FetAB permease component